MIALALIPNNMTCNSKLLPISRPPRPFYVVAAVHEDVGNEKNLGLV